MDKSKTIKLDQKIINSITPFSRISYDKTKEVDVFVGRENYLKILTEALFKSIFSDQSFGINVSGPGGCGKSTLFGYFMQLINSKKIFHENYCKLNKDECKIITCFIDAPKGEPTTLKYFWTSIIDALAEENREFLEHFATLLFRKCISVLWIKNYNRTEISNLFSTLIPNIETTLIHNSFVGSVDVEKLLDFIIANEKNLNKINDIVESGWRILQKYEVKFGILGRTGDFSQKRVFKYEKQYFDLLFDILSNDLDKSASAQNIFKGAEGELLKSDSEVITLFNWLTQTWEWIEEKPICFLVGIDNIGYLTQNITDKTSAYPPFIQTILQMRNKLKKFLFVLIGTNEDWRQFNAYISNYQDYRSQLQGFLINRIDLTRLTLTEVLEALSWIMNKFWTSTGSMDPTNFVYPFSEKFFSYLYEYHAHEYRAILNNLNQIWSFYKSETKVIPLTDAFFMIKFIQIKTKELFRDSSRTEKYQFKELYFSNLIDWEKNQVKTKFENVQARHVGAKQSDMVERKITEALKILQEKESPKQIDWVEKTHAISVETEKGKRTRYPDVYIKLARQTLTDKKNTFEIQVKMYDKEKYVKLKKIESSLELLERAYTDALLFLMTGAGLEENAIEEINRLNLADRILYHKPLEEEQLKALAFLISYEEITGRKLTVSIIKEILEILFEQDWDQLIVKIRNIGSYRASRIEEQIKEKQKATLTGFLRSSTLAPHTESPKEASVLGELNSKTATTNTVPILEDVVAPSTLIENQESTQKVGDREITKIDKLIQELGLSEIIDLLKKIHKRYSDSLKELEYIFETATKRTDLRYKGNVTKDYLKKRVPAHLSDENISELFLRLKNEHEKNQIPKDNCIFTYRGTSLSITKLGTSFYSLLKKLN